MKRIRSSLYYFKISQNNPEPQLDLDYFIINKEPKIKEYIKNVKNIKEILITIKKLNESGESEKITAKYYQKLFNNFNNFSNCSELGCFVNACDTTRDLIKKDFQSFKRITNLFIQKRILDDKAPENWIQAIIDNNASRKKGTLGENKLLRILRNYGFKEIETWDKFFKSKKCAAQFSPDIFNVNNVREKLNIQLSTRTQNKKLDLIIKNNKRVFLCEAKHLNVSGGGQDKQISELIEILSLKEKNKNISYIAFLDGSYSNIILSNIGRGEKIKMQREEINQFLIRNPHNFWLNTAGFKTLFFDLTKK